VDGIEEADYMEAIRKGRFEHWGFRNMPWRGIAGLIISEQNPLDMIMSQLQLVGAECLLFSRPGEGTRLMFVTVDL
jgi:hypothetical protein